MAMKFYFLIHSKKMTRLKKISLKFCFTIFFNVKCNPKGEDFGIGIFFIPKIIVVFR